ncbi:MAG: SIS domain-containing protein [Oscillospiraceae bacterium]|jgi:glucosamine--fructose-6-phosphate aminotransferase (isomerizing)|nr:SIS domain-containing protein [Oscillospiraceae bacterium]
MTQMTQEILETPGAIAQCLAANGDKLAALVAEIQARDIQQVILAARGTSDHAATYGKYALELLTGVPVSLAASSIYTIYGKGLRLQKNALVIGISQSGAAADVLAVLAGAKAAGALTVGITNNEQSGIAQSVDVHLSCAAGPELSVAATKTFTTEIFLLAKLAALWAQNAALNAELDALPQTLQSVLAQADAVESIVTRYRFIDSCFVLARGVNYAIAQEAALKIQETTYVRALAFAASDFLHGPIAMLHRDIPALIFAPTGAALPDIQAILTRLAGENVETLVVTDDSETARLGSFALRVPSAQNELVSPFYGVLIAQMFACSLSLLKGLTPDTPRGLNKVTITK